jgi:hypothetical protein
MSKKFQEKLKINKKYVPGKIQLILKITLKNQFSQLCRPSSRSHIKTDPNDVFFSRDHSTKKTEGNDVKQCGHETAKVEKFNKGSQPIAPCELGSQKILQLKKINFYSNCQSEYKKRHFNRKPNVEHNKFLQCSAMHNPIKHETT